MKSCTVFHTFNPIQTQDLQHFPNVQLRLKIPRGDPDGGKLPSLNIRLEKTNFHKKSSRAFIPRFPKIKEEAWRLVLGNTSTSELYAMKRVSFSDRLVTHMELPSTPYTVKFQIVILGMNKNILGRRTC